MSTEASFPPTNCGVDLSVENLHRSFEGKPVLKGISLEIQPGEIFVIMGPSGSGKSVLLRHLIGLEKPDQGEIHITGKCLEEPGVRDQFRMAMVFQSGALLNSLTVGENVGLYLKEHRLKSDAEIAQAVRDNLAAVGLRDVEDQFPAQLSGGMKKRVAIARALVINPHIIFYDEPTSELDPLMADVVGNEIAKLNQRNGVTSIVVSHDRALALGIAHRIAIIRDGEIVAVDTPAGIRESTDPFIKDFLLAGNKQRPL